MYYKEKANFRNLLLGLLVYDFCSLPVLSLFRHLTAQHVDAVIQDQKDEGLYSRDDKMGSGRRHPRTVGSRGLFPLPWAVRSQLHSPLRNMPFLSIMTKDS